MCGLRLAIKIQALDKVMVKKVFCYGYGSFTIMVPSLACVKITYIIYGYGSFTILVPTIACVKITYYLFLRYSKSRNQARENVSPKINKLHARVSIIHHLA